MKKIIFLAALTTFCLVGCKKEKVVINEVADLIGKKIGVQTGTTGEIWVIENMKNKDVRLLSFKTGIDVAFDLKNGSIDAVILDELPAKEIVARNPDLTIVRDKIFADNKEEYAIAVKKGNSRLLDAINDAISEMKNNGDYEKLVAAFMPVDGNIVVPENEPAGGEKTLKLGTNAAFPPFEYVEGRKIVGFDITMSQKIAKNAGRRLEVIDLAFESLIPALQSNTIDFIAAGMSITEERKKFVDFSVPYFQSEQVLIVRK